jgi:hypothetical protein
MFLLDTLMIAGIRWALETTVAAAEAEMNDDSALREQLLEMEMRREMGEITDEEFAETEADLLARIRAIKERRDGGSGPLGFSGDEPLQASPDSRFQVEASVTGDFHEPAQSPQPPEPTTRTPRTTRTSRTSRTTRTTRTTRTIRTIRTTRKVRPSRSK